MGDIAKPILTMHCFNNLVEFVNLHKFETVSFAVQWRTLLLNVMLSGVDTLAPLVQDRHISRLLIFVYCAHSFHAYITCLHTKAII